MGGQGSPPGRNPTGIELNVLVGDAKAGEAYFAAACATCHSVTGDLKGIGVEVSGPARAAERLGRGIERRLRRWRRPRRRRRRRQSGDGDDGGRLEARRHAGAQGRLARRSSTLPDGTRKSIARNNGVPKVDVKDPNEAHKKMVLELDDPDNKKMHDVTAYLWTIK